MSGGAWWMANSLPYPGLGLPFPLGLLTLFLVLYLLYQAATFPLGVVSGYRLPREYGLSVQSFRGWLADWAKSLVIGLVIAGVVVVFVYWTMTVSPDWWWLLSGAGAALFSVVLANLSPVLLLPLFYKLTPIAQTDLARRLEALAEQAGARVRGVYSMELSAKSTGANAMLMGWGQTRRVVLTDTLIERYTSPEIEVVLAHELGHHVHRDIPKLIVIQSGLMLVSFGLAQVVLSALGPSLGVSSPADPRGLPLLGLTLGIAGAVAMPLTNAISRRIERAADRFALRQTGLAPAFIAAMDKLADQNLAESQPPRWAELLFASHPTHHQRVALARRFESEHGALRDEEPNLWGARQSSSSVGSSR